MMIAASRYFVPCVIGPRGEGLEVEPSNLSSFPNVDWLRNILLVSAGQQGLMRNYKISRAMARKVMSNLAMLHLVILLSCSLLYMP